MPKKSTRAAKPPKPKPLPWHSAPYWMDVPRCIFCGHTDATWTPNGCSVRADHEARRRPPASRAA